MTSRLSLFCLLWMLAHSGYAAEAPIKKLAFLVGVAKYDKAGLNPLEYPESDMKKVGRALQDAGFTVTTMLGNDAGPRRATLANLKTELLEKFATREIRQLNRQDVLLIVLSGHGLQMVTTRDGKPVEDSFFCPVDTLKSDVETMLSISELMRKVSTNSGAENNLIVIDACRDNPSKGAKSLDGSLVTALPVNTAVLFGASAGTRSYESDKLQSGLLAHYFTEGVLGAARDPDGEITWGTLVSYVKKSVSRNSIELVGQAQRPNDISNLQGESPLLARVKTVTPSNIPSKPTEHRPGEVREDNGLRLKLVFCATSSPEPKTSEFWIGKYEVTQSEWRAVMKSDPSWFQANGEGAEKVSGMNTDRFPVENISWNQARQFCETFTHSERLAGRLPSGYVYRLPTVAEWEQAAGTAITGRIDVDQVAWHFSSADYRSHEVGTRAATSNGLFDILGNVAEWCLDIDESDNSNSSLEQSRKLQGGSWIDSSARMQSNVKSHFPADKSLNCYGFRVVLAPEK